MKSSFSNRNLSDRSRLLLLLAACEAADISPVQIQTLHALIFIADILAPIWSQGTYDGKVLKLGNGPFYPDLQRELDSLVGLGLVDVHDVRHVMDGKATRLSGAFSLNVIRAGDAIDDLLTYSSEEETSIYFKRLLLSVARIGRPFEELVGQDVTWSDKRTSKGDVIDFAEWKAANYSAYVAKQFDQFVPEGLTTTPGERLQLYMRLLEKRAK